MDKKIIKAELLAINPNLEENDVQIDLIFSNIARYATDELLKVTIPITDWLEFLEACFIQFDKPEHIPTSTRITLEFQKTQILIIGDNTYSFAIPKSKWKRFVEEQVEKLYLAGVISM
jgi:hypothetical protein